MPKRNIAALSDSAHVKVACGWVLKGESRLGRTRLELPLNWGVFRS